MSACLEAAALCSSHYLLNGNRLLLGYPESIPGASFEQVLKSIRYDRFEACPAFLEMVGFLQMVRFDGAIQ